MEELWKARGIEELGESKQRSRHGGNMGKLQAWSNKEKVSKDQGMEEIWESYRHGATRRKLVKIKS
jgi:hypothetical protein